MNDRVRVRVKICGVTRLEDALQAVAVGADAIGLIFVPGSRRCLSLQQARRISNAIPPLVTRIALVMDPDPHDLDRILDQVSFDLIQFHGSETDAFCKRFGRPYIKAMSVDEIGAPGWDHAYPGARGFIIDSHAAGAAGGTGKTFDWARFPNSGKSTRRPLILAGGLNIENVATAIRACKPYAVDVSSGVESSPGVKDKRLMRKFMNEVHRASDW